MGGFCCLRRAPVPIACRPGCPRPWPFSGGGADGGRAPGGRWHRPHLPPGRAAAVRRRGAQEGTAPGPPSSPGGTRCPGAEPGAEHRAAAAGGSRPREPPAAAPAKPEASRLWVLLASGVRASIKAFGKERAAVWGSNGAVAPPDGSVGAAERRRRWVCRHRCHGGAAPAVTGTVPSQPPGSCHRAHRGDTAPFGATAVTAAPPPSRPERCTSLVGSSGGTFIAINPGLNQV